MNENQMNIKFNFAFVLRVEPADLEKIKDFIEKLENVVIVYSQISGNRLYIREERAGDASYL